MNFLSHLYLSGNSDPILIGNFIGDFVKGKQMEAYPAIIAKGIKLHREIDFFTDNHEVVSKSKDKFRKKNGHYSGVVVDVFYDHFLAANWKSYSSLPLEQFAQNTYATLKKNQALLPEKARFMLPYMIRDNWLVSYSYIEGVDRACKGIARRTKFKSNMESAVVLLKQHYLELNEEFDLFFPALINHCKNYLSEEG